ncbi:MAG: hypothetical protein EOS82_03245 [Mesorhizobium sp.]|uniref:hypothetical protein n=1 Tax=Mesorhizobium sp. TaxID=1871066 RepID=UPI000FE50E5A|nr:hypothetical protein [Mesorhizobium sp.]RWQ56525.1 MAG: hypothetical protein EOS82_03245 [Mesorhizobium sp.]
MTARDSIDRLNRSRSQIRGELPDRAPLDHIERMFDTKQPQKDRRVCHHFPGWLCGDECIDILPARSPAVRRILAAMLVAVALIIAGLVYAGLPS